MPGWKIVMLFWLGFFLPWLIMELFSVYNLFTVLHIDKTWTETYASIEDKDIDVSESDGDRSYTYNLIYNYTVSEKNFHETRDVWESYYHDVEIWENILIKYIESNPEKHVIAEDNLYFIYMILIPFGLPFTLIWFFILRYGIKKYRKVKYLENYGVEYDAEILSISFSNVEINNRKLVDIFVKIYWEEIEIKHLEPKINDDYSEGDTIPVLYNSNNYSEVILNKKKDF